MSAMEFVFTSEVIEWRGPAPYHFVPVPEDESADVREVAALATYGWGVIPVEARIGEVSFTTSLFPGAGRLGSGRRRRTGRRGSPTWWAKYIESRSGPSSARAWLPSQASTRWSSPVGRNRDRIRPT